MWRLGTLFCLAVATLLLSNHAAIGDSGIRVSKHTTRFTEPLNEDGTVNFAEAVNRHFGADITPDQNSAVLLYEILGPAPEGGKGLSEMFFARLGMPVPPADGDYFLAMGTWLKERNGGKWDEQVQDKYYAMDRQLRSRPWKSEDSAEGVAWLDSISGHLRKLKQAVNRPRYFSPLILPVDEGGSKGMMIAVLLPGIQKSRSLARALITRTYLALGEERYDDALDDILTCFRLGRHLGQGPTLIEGLVGIAIDSMAIKCMLKYIELARPDLDKVTDIRKELATLLPLPDVAECVTVAERAMFMDVSTHLAEGRTSIAEIAGGEAAPMVKNVQDVARSVVDWNIILRKGNEWYDRMVAAMRQPNRPMREKAASQIEADLQNIRKTAMDPKTWARVLVPGQATKVISDQMGSVMIALMLPAVSAAGTAVDRATQNNNNLQIALALSAWRRSNGGYPDKLAELAPQYLEEVPEDLFIRSDLQYKRTDDGYLLYSLGPNATDDEGRWYDDDPAGDDLSVRMPIPPEKDR